MTDSRIEYRITVSRFETIRETRRDWVKLREQYADEQTWLSPDDREKRDADPPFGYREVPANIRYETKLLEQTIDTLDLAAVIKAVNAL